MRRISIIGTPRPTVTFQSGLLGMILALTIFTVTPSGAAEKIRTPVDLSTAIVQVAKRNIPAVVHIEVTGQQEVAVPTLPFENDPFFRHFFGTPNSPKKYKRELKGMGTGMLMDQQGHILTNYHVVGAATKIEVQLSNGNKYSAKLIGTDPKTDLAVIGISARERVSNVTFGDSDRIEVGEWVVAIGHPRGLDQTVTQGIISAKHRQGITDPTGYQDFLQTDAAINPGNSGGPLLNLYGEVIGVNTIIVSNSGGFEGIGLAIPSNMALYIANRLISHGKVERGWLGVAIKDMSPEQAKLLGLASPRGAVIEETVKGGPADRAGLRKGDVVTAVQGKEVLNGASFRNEVAIMPVGTDVTITFIREGKRVDAVLKIGGAQEAGKATSQSVRERLGVEVRPLNQKETRKYRFNRGQGAAVAWADPKGPLGKAGLEAGDIILEINGMEVGEVKDVTDIVGTLRPHQEVTVLAVDYRTGNTGYVKAVVR
jgi:serine protease Do